MSYIFKVLPVIYFFQIISVNSLKNTRIKEKKITHSEINTIDSKQINFKKLSVLVGT